MKNLISAHDYTETGKGQFNLQLFAEDPPPATPPATPPAADPAVVPPAGDPPATPPANPPAGDPAAPPAGTPPAQPPVGAPTEYADFTVPDGMTFNKESAADFVTVAKDLNLTQEQAQKLVDLYGSREVSRIEQQNAERQGWMDASLKTYKPEEIELAKNTLNRFAGEEFKTFLNDTGLNVHPQMIAVFQGIGKLISEAEFKDGGGSGQPLSDAELFYPNMKKK